MWGGGYPIVNYGRQDLMLMASGDLNKRIKELKLIQKIDAKKQYKNALMEFILCWKYVNKNVDCLFAMIPFEIIIMIGRWIMCAPYELIVSELAIIPYEPLVSALPQRQRKCQHDISFIPHYGTTF